MAVFPDKIVLKNSTDAKATIESLVGAGGTDAIVPGEVVVGRENGAIRLYATDSTGAVRSVTSGAVTSVGITPGTGITSSGGPITSSGDITVGLANTAVTPGTYTNATVTVDQQGRITSAATGSGGGGGASAINDLTDVDTVTFVPSANQALAWNGLQWVPTTQGLSAPTSDPNFSNVLLQVPFYTDSADDSSQNISIAATRGTPTLANVSATNSSLGSFLFNGSSDITYTNTASNLNLNTSDFTIEGWVYLDSTHASTAPAVACHGTYNVAGFWLLNYSSSPAQFQFQFFDGATIQTVVVKSSPTKDAWHHLAVVRDGSSIYTYYDGALVTTYSITTSVNLNNAENLAIGSNRPSPTTPTNWWKGYIQGFRLTNAVARYSSTFTPTYLENYITPEVIPINRLSDVDTATTPPTNTQVLSWSSTNSKWVPARAGIYNIQEADDFLLNNNIPVSYYYPTYIGTSTSFTGDGQWGKSSFYATNGIWYLRKIDQNGQTITPVTGTYWWSTNGTTWNTGNFSAVTNSTTYWTLTDNPRTGAGSVSSGAIYIALVDPTNPGTAPLAAGDYLRYDGTDFRPQKLEATQLRSFLGIGEYATDAAAGTGGVTSGALYFNTTSSKYVLKT